MFPPSITRHLIHPLRGRLNRYHHSVRQSLFDLQQSQWLSRDELLDIQQRKLAGLCINAYSNTEYYRRIFDEAAADAGNIKQADLKRVPILEKKHIRDNFTGMTSVAYQPEELISRSSGGSTGEPIWVLIARSTMPFGAAIKQRGYEWTGWFPGAAHHWLWGAPTDTSTRSIKGAIWSSLYNQEFVNAYETSDALFQQRHEIYNRRPPYLLESYANILYEFAKYIEDNDLPQLNIPAVITSAETLHDFQRAKIKKSISENIYNRYGCREVGDMAQECEQHSELHINMERFIVELDATDDDGFGDILITDLENYAFPLIRYRNGDRGRLSSRNCDCGRGLVMLEQVSGRTLDVVVTPEGRKISGVLFPQVFKDFEEIILGQVIQKSVTDIEIRLRLKANLTSEAERQLVEKISMYTGPSVAIRLNYADEILVTRTGKCRPVISEIVD